MENNLILVTQELVDKGLKHGFSLILAETELRSFFQLAQTHKLTNIVLESLIRQYPANPALNEAKSEILCNRQIYLTELKKIDEKLKTGKINYMLIKGMPLSDFIFGDPHARVSLDIDLVLNDQDIPLAYSALRELGYKQANNDSDSFVYSFIEAYHEILMVKSYDEKCCFVEIKRGSSATGINNRIWFSDMATYTIEALNLQTQSQIWTILHLFANTFHDNEDTMIFHGSRLRNYFDIAYLLNHKNIDWNKVLIKAQEVECIHKLHEVLKSVTEIYKINNFDVEQLIKRTERKYCTYELTAPLMDDTPDISHNSGTMAYKIKANAKYTIFDKDFKYYEFVRNYKAFVFSKKNPNYLLRIQLTDDGMSSPRKYKYSEKEIFYYFVNGVTFDVYCKIRSEDIEYFDNNDFIKIEWVDGNYFSPIYYQFCEYPVYDEFEVRKEAQLKDAYYSESFLQKNIQFLVRPEIIMKRYSDDKYFYYVFSFPKDIVFELNGYIMIEIKLCKKINENLSCNKSYVQDIVELMQ